MADPSSPPGLTAAALRKAAEANMRYYQAWGRLARQWFDDITAVSREAMATGDRPAQPSNTAEQAPAPAAAHPPQDTAAAPALVLEAAAGAEVAGAFLVENHLGHPVDAVVLADPVEGVDDLVLHVEPPRVSLAPQESAVVKVRATIPVTMVSGVEHRTTLRVPDLPGSSISVLVRRTD